MVKFLIRKFAAGRTEITSAEGRQIPFEELKNATGLPAAIMERPAVAGRAAFGSSGR